MSKCWPKLHGSGHGWAEVGQQSATFCQLRRAFDQVWASSAEVGPGSAEFGSMLVGFCPIWLGIDRTFHYPSDVVSGLPMKAASPGEHKADAQIQRVPPPPRRGRWATSPRRSARVARSSSAASTTSSSARRCWRAAPRCLSRRPGACWRCAASGRRHRGACGGPMGSRGRARMADWHGVCVRHTLAELVSGHFC